MSGLRPPLRIQKNCTLLIRLNAYFATGRSLNYLLLTLMSDNVQCVMCRHCFKKINHEKAAFSVKLVNIPYRQD